MSRGASERGSALEVLAVYTRLGLSCFGGPIAHIGYFRDEFVVRRRWLDEQSYADLVALWRAPPLAVVVVSALGGMALAQATS